MLYTKTKLNRIEITITKAVKKVQDAGLVIGQGEWGIDSKKKDTVTYPPAPNWICSGGKCCMTGAVLLTMQPEPAVTINTDAESKVRATACAALDIEYEFLSGMLRAYDKVNFNYPDVLTLDWPEIYVQGFNFGKKLGEKFLPPKIQMNNRNFKLATRSFVILWALSFLAGLGMTGLIVYILVKIAMKL